jgi:hypothetical protein
MHQDSIGVRKGSGDCQHWCSGHALLSIGELQSFPLRFCSIVNFLKILSHVVHMIVKTVSVTCLVVIAVDRYGRRSLSRCDHMTTRGATSPSSLAASLPSSPSRATFRSTSLCPMLLCDQPFIMLILSYYEMRLSRSRAMIDTAQPVGCAHGTVFDLHYNGVIAGRSLSSVQLSQLGCNAVPMFDSRLVIDVQS